MSLMIILGKGWMYIKESLNQEDMGQITIIMALVYMSFSALFLTYDIPDVLAFMLIWITLLYLYICYYIQKSCQ